MFIQSGALDITFRSKTVEYKLSGNVARIATFLFLRLMNYFNKIDN